MVIFEWIKPYFGIILFVIVLVFLLIMNKWIFSKIKNKKSSTITIKNMIIFFLLFISLPVFVLVLPIDGETKGQILAFLGIVISAGIALSSTTVLGNLIAGIMNQSMRRYAIGDLIQIDEIQGRVTKRNIFHTELQLEDSNFITIPNLQLVNKPVKLTRKNNTVISTTVSLGYDVSRLKIGEALKQAATKTGLTDPYVYIEKLNDFSVEYKIHGFLDDCSKYFSTNSNLNENVLDSLHENNIEIVSPIFHNQRQLKDQIFIPPTIRREEDQKKEKPPEELIFDEAIKSEEIEKKKQYLNNINKKILEWEDSLKKEKSDLKKDQMELKIERLREIQAKINKNIEEYENEEKE